MRRFVGPIYHEKFYRPMKYLVFKFVTGRGLWASPFFLQSPRPAKFPGDISKAIFSRGVCQDGGDEQMFGAK
jgi:hypothetical protein